MVCRHRGTALLLAILLFLPAESGRGDETKSASVNLFGTHRFDEDFRYLKDPSRGTDLWDTIKYIPLDNREEWYLSLGGELRERYVYLSNPGFGLQGQGTEDYLLHRVLLSFSGRSWIHAISFDEKPRLLRVRSQRRL